MGAEEVVDGGAEGGITLEAAFHCADETGGDDVAAGTLGQGSGGRETDDVAGVRDRHDALDLIGDVRKGRLAIHDLIENTTQTPDVRGFAELHHFPHHVRLEPFASSSTVGVGVDEGFGGHVVRGADVLFAVDVDGVVGDGVGDAEVDEFEAAGQHEEVGRFEVRVQDVERVHGGHALEHLLPEVARPGEVEAATSASPGPSSAALSR